MPGDILDAALAYRSKGWPPLPVEKCGKRPLDSDWPNFQPTDAALDEKFGRGRANVGVLLGEPSGYLADVDLDSPEARSLARHFLPETGRVFGRSGAPSSHYLYVAKQPTERFSDPTGGGNMLVELRSTGAQTVFPPSIHASGERVEWEKEDEPCKVNGAELRNQVARLAAASLIARHWPTGNRHLAAMALGGLLIRGWGSVDEASVFVLVVRHLNKNQESTKR